MVSTYATDIFLSKKMVLKLAKKNRDLRTDQNLKMRDQLVKIFRAKMILKSCSFENEKNPTYFRFFIANDMHFLWPGKKDCIFKDVWISWKYTLPPPNVIRYYFKWTKRKVFVTSGGGIVIWVPCAINKNTKLLLDSFQSKFGNLKGKKSRSWFIHTRINLMKELDSETPILFIYINGNQSFVWQVIHRLETLISKKTKAKEAQRSTMPEAQLESMNIGKCLTLLRQHFELSFFNISHSCTVLWSYCAKHFAPGVWEPWEKAGIK